MSTTKLPLQLNSLHAQLKGKAGQRAKKMLDELELVGKLIKHNELNSFRTKIIVQLNRTTGKSFTGPSVNICPCCKRPF